ncbi:GntR family transcriptional regulator [Streptomyces formicae]
MPTRGTQPDFAPRYHTIEQALRRRIAGLQPHAPLPSETELAREFEVSRMTARSAVLRLVADGLVYRESGRGTFVAPPPSGRRADSLVRFSEEMRRQGRLPSSEVVARERRVATAAEAEQLRLATGTEVVAVERVRLADGTPVARERSAFPVAVAALLERDLATGSLHEALVDLGHTPSFGHAVLSADSATREDAELLGLARGTALLVERRLILDQHGDPLESTESRYAGERYSLTVTFDVEHG